MVKKPVHFVRVFGIILIVLGILALLAQVFQLDLGTMIWPFFIILPGILLFLFGMSLEGSLSEPIVMLSGIVLVTGLLLLYQALTGHWASWAYAWALIVPTGAGIAQLLYGALVHRKSAVRSGASLVNIGFIIFIAGLIFFELILNLSGWGLGFIGWPILFIGLGLYALVKGLLKPHK